MISAFLLFFLMQAQTKAWPDGAFLPSGCQHMYDPGAIDTTVGIITCSNGLRISYDKNDLCCGTESRKAVEHCPFEDDDNSYERILLKREERVRGNLMCIQLESFWGAEPDPSDAVEREAIADLTALDRNRRRGKLSVYFPNYDETSFMASIANRDQYELALRVLRSYPRPTAKQK